MNGKGEISHTEKDGYNLVSGPTKATPTADGQNFEKAEITIYKGSIDFSMKEGYVTKIDGKEIEFGAKSTAENTGVTLV